LDTGKLKAPLSIGTNVERVDKSGSKKSPTCCKAILFRGVKEALHRVKKSKTRKGGGEKTLGRRMVGRYR